MKLNRYKPLFLMERDNRKTIEKVFPWFKGEIFHQIDDKYSLVLANWWAGYVVEVALEYNDSSLLEKKDFVDYADSIFKTFQEEKKSGEVLYPLETDVLEAIHDGRFVETRPVAQGLFGDSFWGGDNYAKGDWPINRVAKDLHKLRGYEKGNSVSKKDILKIIKKYNRLPIIDKKDRTVAIIMKKRLWINQPIFVNLLNEVSSSQWSGYKKETFENIRDWLRGRTERPNPSEPTQLDLKSLTYRDAKDTSIKWHDYIAKEGKNVALDTGEKVMSFSDGWYWVSLGTSSCDDEGESMGHCGRSNYGTNGNMYSLRSPKHIPKVTLDVNMRDGTIGQAKGKGNTKPKEKYHKYIVDFVLNNKDVKIKKSDLSEQNYGEDFLFSDLDKSAFLDVYKKRPSVISTEDVISAIGQGYLPEKKLLDYIATGDNETINSDGSVSIKHDNWIDAFNRYFVRDAMSLAEQVFGEDYFEFYTDYPIDKDDAWEMIKDHASSSAKKDIENLLPPTVTAEGEEWTFDWSDKYEDAYAVYGEIMYDIIEKVEWAYVELMNQIAQTDIQEMFFDKFSKYFELTDKSWDGPVVTVPKEKVLSVLLEVSGSDLAYDLENGGDFENRFVQSDGMTALTMEIDNRYTPYVDDAYLKEYFNEVFEFSLEDIKAFEAKVA